MVHYQAALMSHYIGETAAAVVSTEPVGCFAPLSLRSTSLLRGVRTTYPNPNPKGTQHERSTARDGLLVCSGRMTATSTPRAVGRSRGAFVSLLLGARHERSTARDGLLECSGRMTATCTPRAVDRSRDGLGRDIGLRIPTNHLASGNVLPQRMDVPDTEKDNGASDAIDGLRWQHEAARRQG